MSLEVWGDESWDAWTELPDGWWDENTVAELQEAVNALLTEPVYEDGEKDKGISVRFLARISVLKLRAELATSDEPLIAEALKILGVSA
ncbi:MAG: hypothetical protein WC714_29090 [Candidatus Obscuribacterales bacterium]|jgi:hypothetical protein